MAGWRWRWPGVGLVNGALDRLGPPYVTQWVSPRGGDDLAFHPDILIGRLAASRPLLGRGRAGLVDSPRVAPKAARSLWAT